MTDKPISEMTPEEAHEEIRRRSPAVAFAQDMGWFPGAPPKIHEEKLDPLGTIPLSTDIAAAIQTNRSELLQVPRGRVEKASKPLSVEDMTGLYTLLEDYYERNAQGPVQAELLEAIRPVEERLSAPTVEDSLFLLDKLRVILETFDHRRKEIQEGSVPIDQIPDGQVRAAPY